ncbi:MAG: hypothetical protein J2P24_14650 [Streptosporangiales bacterium]|nr:hypothetical protein [Streptosporangiales bacterium]
MAQLREGRLTRRLVQLHLGLVLYGVSMAFMIRANLGLDPWDVLHQGIVSHVGLSFGTVVILVSGVVLLLWIPLRQWPGLGTVSNAIVIGLVVDRALAVLHTPDALWARVGFVVGAVLMNALATAAYVGARLGPGARDGLMTGLVRRTGWSVRVVRTCIEASVLLVGWLLGGSAGVATVVYAFGIGPLTQLLLPYLTVRPESSRARERPR